MNRLQELLEKTPSEVTLVRRNTEDLIKDNFFEQYKKQNAYYFVDSPQGESIYELQIHRAACSKYDVIAWGHDLDLVIEKAILEVERGNKNERI